MKSHYFTQFLEIFIGTKEERWSIDPKEYIPQLRSKKLVDVSEEIKRKEKNNNMKLRKKLNRSKRE